MQDHLTVLPCRVTQQKMIVKTAKRQASHCYLLMLLRSGWLYDISNSYDNSFYMMESASSSVVQCCIQSRASSAGGSVTTAVSRLSVANPKFAKNRLHWTRLPHSDISGSYRCLGWSSDDRNLRCDLRCLSVTRMQFKPRFSAILQPQGTAGNGRVTATTAKEPYWPQSKRKPPAAFRKTTAAFGRRQKYLQDCREARLELRRCEKGVTILLIIGRYHCQS